jgi:tetratricopeptide (TPR) repeat protein
MLRLTKEINRQLETQLAESESARIEVRCATCHHGLSRPQTLVEVLDAAFVKQGEEAATAKYRQLRAEYYGSDSFDFGESTLAEFARTLARRQQIDSALHFLRLNLEFYPRAAETYLIMAEVHLKRGDRDQARNNYQKVLELAPDNSFVRERLQQLDQPSP